jgi:hypothetical protein
MTRQTNTVLDSSLEQQPWWRRGRTPVTALQIACAELEQCRKEQLEQADKEEYHKAMNAMLKVREKRLQADISRLSQKDDVSPPQGG